MTQQPASQAVPSHPTHTDRSPLRHAARRIGVLLAVACLAVLGGAGVATAEQQEQAAPNVPRPAVTDVAHRGASAYAPENTLAAMTEADNLGASMVEADVQRTADGELVMMHDTTLERTTDVEEVFPDRGSYAVGDFTLAELRQLDAGSWFGADFAGEPIPTLRETLDHVRGLRVGFLLEVKAPELYPGIERDVARELRRDPWWLVPARPGQPHRLVIQSFDWEVMESSHQLLPWIPHGLLGRVDEDQIADYARWADQINPNFRRIDDDYVAAVQEAGLEIYVYTVNDPDDMRAQLDRGVDGIISDYPDVLLDVIAGHQAAA